MFRHGGEDGELGRGQRDVTTIHDHVLARSGCIRLGGGGLGQDFADHGDQLAGAERPGEPPAGPAGNGAGTGPQGQAAGSGARNEEDDRRAQRAPDAPWIQARHGEIEHRGRVRAAGKLGDHLPRVGDQMRAQPVPAQVAARHLGHLGLVLGQQDRVSLGSGHRSALGWREGWREDRSGQGRG
jgi:hypothetical protein